MSLRLVFESQEGHALAQRIVRSVENFDREGRIIYGGRNIIKVFDSEEPSLNIKRYRIPALFNRIVYSTLRRPKGHRAFKNACRLVQAGIDTPAPLAYFEERRFGLLAHSFLVTRQMEGYSDCYFLGDDPMTSESSRALVRAIVEMVVKMHESGIEHLDFSPGNILWRRETDGSVSLCLVDINRMRYGSIAPRRGIRNFARLWGQPEMFRLIAEEYARLRGADPHVLLADLKSARRRFWTRFARRHPLKYTLRLD